MKNKILLMFFILILCNCTGCDISKFIDGEVDFEKQPNCINVVVSGVDDGLLHCKYVCEWEDSYAYYDQGVIYYFENSGSNPYQIECAGLIYMDMNGEYIYYTQGTVLKVFEKESKDVTEITEMGEVLSIDVLMGEVIVVCDETGNGRIYYEMVGADICKEAVVKYSNVFVSLTHNCVNCYNYSNIYVYSDGNIYRLNGEGYEITDESGTDGEFYEYQDINIPRYSSPEHTAIYDGKIYVLQQATYATGSVGLNMNYRHKEWDQLICFDPSTQTSESIYKTNGPEEQMVNFSIENNEMYLLIEGVLYKTNLKGEEKKKLADLSGIAPTLSFDYANDTLFVYDGEKLIGQYK